MAVHLIWSPPSVWEIVNLVAEVLEPQVEISLTFELVGKAPVTRDSCPGSLGPGPRT